MQGRKQPIVVISIQTSCDDRGDGTSLQTASAVETLADVLNSCQLSRTWIVDVASKVPALAKQLDSAWDEVAMLGQAAWCAPGVSRSELSETAGKELLGARAVGRPVSTLSLPVPADVAHRDWWAKQGVSAIVPHAPNTVRKSRWSFFGSKSRIAATQVALRPKALCWGLWTVPCACDLMQESRRSLRRWLDATIADRSAWHTRITLSDVVLAPRRATAWLSEALETIGSACQSGELVSRTIANAAAQWTRPHADAPAQSILRAAA